MIISENLFEPSTPSSIEMLKQHFPNCFDKNGNFLPEKIAEQVQSQGINTSREYYTMNWLGKSYARYLRDCPPTTLLSENVVHNKLPENENSQNLLIKGDNLEVLKHLKQAYSGEVKMIYIDPPYNTGSDGFVYQDDRKFTPEQLAELADMSIDEAKRVLDFTAKKSNSHSAWLTFMYPRLYIARELLKDDGVIFISIDDNEQAQLKLLCDEVFGEGNFISSLVWSLGTGTQAGHFVRSHENILVYFKNKSFVPNFSGGEGIIEHSALKKISVKNPESEFLFPKGTRWDASDNVELFDTWGNSEKTTLISGRMLCKDNKLVEDVVLSAGWAQKKQMEKWFSGQETIDTKGQKVLRFYFNKSGILRYEKERNIINPPTLLQNIASTKNGSDEIIQLFQEKIFDYPKPIKLLAFLLNIITDKDNLVLDFFAGSGTTAHAVMQLNAEDKGNRRFICVQLPEPTDKKSEAYKAGYNTIFDITKARIEKSAVKIRQDFPDFQGDVGFKIFETTDNFLEVSDDDVNPQQLNLPESLNHTLSDDEYHTLLTTWRLYDGQFLTDAVQAVNLGGYIANLCGDNLYLLYPYFYSEHIKALLDKLDNTPSFLPKRIILFGTNIDSAKQMELHQAIRTYTNKKNIELNLLVRY